MLALSKDRVFLLFCEWLEKKGLSYCVVGDSRGYPDNISGDVDIVLEERKIYLSTTYVVEFTNEYRLKLVQVLQHEQNAWYFVLGWEGESGLYDFLALDLCGDYYRNGKCLFSSEKLLRGRKYRKLRHSVEGGFYVPAHETELTYYLLKKVGKGSLNEQQLDHLYEEFNMGGSEVNRLLGQYWPQEQVKHIAEYIQRKDLQGLRKIFPSLVNYSFKCGTHSIILIFREWRRRVRRIVNPTGLLVIFLGPDGVGKSSVIDEMISMTKPAFRGSKKIHLRPRLFQKNMQGGSVDNVADPHGQQCRGNAASIAKVFYFLCDYILGYMYQVAPLLVRSKLVIFDRYYYDLLIDPARYRYGAPMWLARLAKYFIPKPDIVVVLDAPTDIVQLRKREVTWEETNRQRIAYKSFASAERNCVVIDASQPLLSVAGDSSKLVFELLAKRVNKRFG